VVQVFAPCLVDLNRHLHGSPYWFHPPLIRLEYISRQKSGHVLGRPLFALKSAPSRVEIWSPIPFSLGRSVYTSPMVSHQFNHLCRVHGRDSLRYYRRSTCSNTLHLDNDYDYIFYGAIVMTRRKNCQSPPHSFDECRLSARWPPTFRPIQRSWPKSVSRLRLLLSTSTITILVCNSCAQCDAHIYE